MVSVRGLAATPSGKRPTEFVAVPLVAAVAAWAVLRAAGADAAAAAVMAAGASAAIAAVIRVTARWVRFMMSCFLASRASGCSRSAGAGGDSICADSPEGWAGAAEARDECSSPRSDRGAGRRPEPGYGRGREWGGGHGTERGSRVGWRG